MINQTVFSQIVKVANEVLTFTQPADAVLAYFFKHNSKIGKQDRAEISSTIFLLLRNLEKIKMVLPDFSQKPKTAVLCTLMLARGISLSVLENLCDEDSIKILKLLKEKKQFNSLNITAELPQWLIDELSNYYSEDEILALGRSFNNSAFLDVRVNSLKSNRDKVFEQLQNEGFKVEKTPLSPIGIRFLDKISLHKHNLFNDGIIEIQDEGSQILSLLSGAKKGQIVVDFCAGAGGKTLAMGALMQNKGRLYAFDISEKRLHNLKPRLTRSGLGNVLPQLIHNERDVKLQRLYGKCDVVFVDAPCSGTGTIRRNPDIKYRQSPDTIARIVKQQESILQAASSLVASGGRLIYATCSLLSRENEQQIETFLQKNSDFSLINAEDILKVYKTEFPIKNKMLRLNPAIHHTDGFFAAILCKSN